MIKNRTPLTIRVGITLVIVGLLLAGVGYQLTKSLLTKQIIQNSKSHLSHIAFRLISSIETNHRENALLPIKKDIFWAESSSYIDGVFVVDEDNQVIYSGTWTKDHFLKNHSYINSSMNYKNINTHIDEFLEKNSHLVSSYPLRLISKDDQTIRSANLILINDLSEHFKILRSKLLIFLSVILVLIFSVSAIYLYFLQTRIESKLIKIKTILSRLGDTDFDINPFQSNQKSNDELSEIIKDLCNVHVNMKSSLEFQRLLKHSVDNADELILLTDEYGFIIYANSICEKITGFRPMELIGQKTSIQKSGVQSPKFYEDMWKTISRGETWRGQLVNKRKNGELYNEEQTITPIKDKNGKISYFISNKRDISNNVKLQNELRVEKARATKLAEQFSKASSAKSEFLSSISHELRTPMNSIIGNLQLLSDSDNPIEQKDSIQNALNDAKHLEELIDDMFKFSKQTETLKLSSVNKFSPEELVKELYDLFKFSAQSKEIDIGLSIHNLTYKYYSGDPTSIKKILSIMLQNAIKFTHNGSVNIELAVRNENEDYDSLIFSVLDTGIGIRESDTAKIFDEFFQVDATETRAQGGLGLGLALAQKMAHTLGGKIEVFSTYGLGSTFNFTIRLKKFRGALTPKAEAIDNPPPPTSNYSDMRVLLVDDNEMNRLIIKKFCQNITNWTFDDAVNGEEALDLYHKNKYDLILMDIEMPVMDGIKATEEIRSIERAKGSAKIPIVMVTGHALEEYETKSYLAGADFFVTKPVNKKNIQDVISSFQKFRAA